MSKHFYNPFFKVYVTVFMDDDDDDDEDDDDDDDNDDPKSSGCPFNFLFHSL